MEENRNDVTMVRPIIAYGHKILRQTCSDIEQEDGHTELLLTNLWDTLDFSEGVGLAAPQINNDKNVFVVNSTLMYDELDDKQREFYFYGDRGIKETFINPKIITSSEEKWSEIEGCLSIPGINEQVDRSWEILIEYLDQEFKLQRKQYFGYTAKVIQHEYDHINGKLFIDHLPALKIKLLKSKLKQIISGNVITNYPIKFGH